MHNITIVNNMQTANTINRTLTDTLDMNTKVYNGNINYQYNITQFKLSVNASFNYSNFKTAENKSSSFGPTLGISKAFFNNKIRSNFSYSFFLTESSTSADRPINNFNLGLNYSINKHHSFRFNTRYLFKKNEESTMIHKYQANLMYNFTF